MLEVVNSGMFDLLSARAPPAPQAKSKSRCHSMRTDAAAWLARCTSLGMNARIRLVAKAAPETHADCILQGASIESQGRGGFADSIDLGDRHAGRAEDSPMIAGGSMPRSGRQRSGIAGREHLPTRRRNCVHRARNRQCQAIPYLRRCSQQRSSAAPPVSPVQLEGMAAASLSRSGTTARRRAVSVRASTSADIGICERFHSRSHLKGRDIGTSS